MAHEIRNPLNAAQLHVSFLGRLLDSQRDDPEAIAVIRDEIAIAAERPPDAVVTDFRMPVMEA